ncbi:hypothetical protein FRB93_013608 [Tulasnella sp. JGI-2019a]|nr:hypothetical protein FRB93_013608 [Tulasnella sp. JGI-2019a]
MWSSPNKPPSLQQAQGTFVPLGTFNHEGSNSRDIASPAKASHYLLPTHGACSAVQMFNDVHWALRNPPPGLAYTTQNFNQTWAATPTLSSSSSTSTSTCPSPWTTQPQVSHAQLLNQDQSWEAQIPNNIWSTGSSAPSPWPQASPLVHIDPGHDIWGRTPHALGPVSVVPKYAGQKTLNPQAAAFNPRTVPAPDHGAAAAGTKAGSGSGRLSARYHPYQGRTVSKSNLLAYHSHGTPETQSSPHNMFLNDGPMVGLQRQTSSTSTQPWIHTSCVNEVQGSYGERAGVGPCRTKTSTALLAPSIGSSIWSMSSQETSAVKSEYAPLPLPNGTGEWPQVPQRSTPSTTSPYSIANSQQRGVYDTLTNGSRSHSSAARRDQKSASRRILRRAG